MSVWRYNMLKNGQKLAQIENAVTYSSFSLLQGYPFKIHINTFHCTNWPSKPTFLSAVGK